MTKTIEQLAREAGMQLGDKFADSAQINKSNNGRKKTVSDTTNTSGNTEPSAKLKATPSIDQLDMRDYFAAKAMPVHMAALSTWDAGSQEVWQAEVSRLSYATADAMLEARIKT